MLLECICNTGELIIQQILNLSAGLITRSSLMDRQKMYNLELAVMSV